MPKTQKFPVPPVQPNSNDGKFLDSYGNPVRHGTPIIIESNYNYQHFNNRPAVVEWVPENGMYKFRFTDGEDSGSQHDFYGIHKFRITHAPEKRDIDEILTNQMEHFRVQMEANIEFIEKIQKEIAAFEALKQSNNGN